jgi:hypothetical protein
VSRPGSKDNIKVDIQEIGWKDVDCINVTPDTDKWLTLVKTVLYRRVP